MKTTRMKNLLIFNLLLFSSSTFAQDSTTTSMSFCTSIKAENCKDKYGNFSDLDDVWIHLKSDVVIKDITVNVTLTKLNVMDHSPVSTSELSMKVEDGGKLGYLQLKDLEVTAYTVTIKLTDGTELATGKFSIFSESY